MAHRKIVAGAFTVAKFRRFLADQGPQVLTEPLPFAEGRTLLQESVLHQNRDNNPEGRLAITCACVSRISLSWDEQQPALQQPLAWLLAGILPDASIPHVEGGVTLLDAVFPSDLLPATRAKRWQVVSEVMAFIWQHEPIRFSAPRYEFHTWWKYATFDLDSIIPNVNEHHAKFIKAWHRAHASYESQARFLAHALDVLEVKTQASANDTALSPLAFLGFSPKVKDLLAYPVLQERVACLLGGCPSPIVQNALAFQWWAWAPHDALVRHQTVAGAAWEQLRITDREAAANETLAIQAMSHAFAVRNGGPVSPSNEVLTTLMVGPMAWVPQRYNAFVKEQALQKALPSPRPSRSLPRF